MTENEKIVDQLQRVFNGRAWHGPPLKPLLSDVDVELAMALNRFINPST